MKYAWWIALVACAEPSADVYPFVAVEPSSAPDVRGARLCDEAADPDHAADPIRIRCALETGNFIDPGAELDGPLRVLSYNIERGLKLDAEIAAFREGKIVEVPDVLLLQEVDRGCSRTGFRNVAREIAEALHMAYVFAVEYVELPRASGGGGEITTVCEHGNAILARLPIGNVGAFRHRENVSWYLPPEARAQPSEPRLGGNVAVFADLVWGEAYVHLYSIHFELDLETGFTVQAAQAAEVAAHAEGRPYPVIIAGDTNAASYGLDVAHGTMNDRTIRPVLALGFADAHAALPPEGRGTRQGALIDLMLIRGLVVDGAGVCTACEGLSDHLPIWAKLSAR